jgi:hypothetical protein
VKLRGSVVQMSASEMAGAIYAAVEFTKTLEDTGKLKGLTRGMAAALYLYTLESPFYKVINTLLREVDRTPLKPFFPFLKLILTGARRLPKETDGICRGVAVAFADLDGAAEYVVRKKVVWWPFSSSTQDKDMLLKGGQFLGTTGKRTLFIINPATARNIQDFSAIKKEAERLILPGTPFRVMGVKPEGNLTTVYLEEDTKAPVDLIASGDDNYAMMEPEGFYDLLGDSLAIYAVAFEDDDLYASVEPEGAGAGTTVHALHALQVKCARLNPKGGFCKNSPVGRSTFCQNHSCPAPGCTEGKSSSAAQCAKHVHAIAAEAAGKAAHAKVMAAAATARAKVVAANPAAARAVNEVVHEGGWTALLLAAGQGEGAEVDALLAAGADPHKARPNGATPVWIAAQEGHVAIVAALLAAGTVLFFPTGNLHSRMPLDRTHVRLKRTCV